MQPCRSTEPLLYTVKKNTRWAVHDHLLSNTKDASVQTFNFRSSVVMSIHICQYCPSSAAEEKTIVYNLQPTTVTQMLVTKAAFCWSTKQLQR